MKVTNRVVSRASPSTPLLPVQGVRRVKYERASHPANVRDSRSTLQQLTLDDVQIPAAQVPAKGYPDDLSLLARHMYQVGVLMTVSS
jgi:hypothetical protein